MKNLIVASILSIVLLAACNNNGKQTADNKSLKDTTLRYFGDTITTDSAIAADQIPAKLKGKDSIKIKVTGKIEAVCQKKGCWMKMNIGNEQNMMVRFKDYGFFVPKDASGKEATIEGYAFIDETSVADLKHYAEDAGKSKEEIEKITQPETKISFEANGVILKK